MFRKKKKKTSLEFFLGGRKECYQINFDKKKERKIQWVSGIQILGSEMIIFESTLTTFGASFIFWSSWGSI